VYLAMLVFFAIMPVFVGQPDRAQDRKA